MLDMENHYKKTRRWEIWRR